MTEERKYVILFAATLLSAGRIVDVLDSSKPNPAKTSSLIRPSKKRPILEKMDQRISGGQRLDYRCRRPLGVAPGALRHRVLPLW